MNTNSFRKVKDASNRPVKGLWTRSGSFYVQTTVKDPASGVKRVKQIHLKALTLANAKAEMESILKTIRECGNVHGAKGPPFGQYRQHYVDTCGKAPKTVYDENGFLRSWENFLGVDTRISDVEPKTILAYRVEKKDLANRTVNLHVRALRQMLKMAKVEGYLQALPFDGLKPLKETSVEKTLFSKEELYAIGTEALRNHPKSGVQVANWICLAMYSGGRVGELLKLQWYNVDFDKKLLHFSASKSKSNYSRHVNFNKNLTNILLCMRATASDSGYLFASVRTNKETTSFKTTLNQIRQALNMPTFTPHSTRHFFISMCVMKGFDFLSIAKWVGHKDGGVLIGKTYGHLNASHLETLASKL